MPYVGTMYVDVDKFFTLIEIFTALFAHIKYLKQTILLSDPNYSLWGIKSDFKMFKLEMSFFAAASAAASIYTDAKIRNGTYVRTYVCMYVCHTKISYLGVT